MKFSWQPVSHCMRVCVTAILKTNSANNRKSCKYLNTAKVVSSAGLAIEREREGEGRE